MLKSSVILTACEKANSRLARKDPRGFQPPKIVAARAIYPRPATISFTKRLLWTIDKKEPDRPQSIPQIITAV